MIHWQEIVSTRLRGVIFLGTFIFNRNRAELILNVMVFYTNHTK